MLSEDAHTESGGGGLVSMVDFDGLEDGNHEKMPKQVVPADTLGLSGVLQRSPDSN